MGFFSAKDEDGSGSDFGVEDGGMEDESSEEDKWCTGCHRSCLTGQDWFGRGQIIWGLPMRRACGARIASTAGG